MNDLLEILDPDSASFFEDASAIAAALIEGEPIGRALLSALIMFEAVEARRAGITPSLSNVEAALRTGGLRTAAE